MSKLTKSRAGKDIGSKQFFELIRAIGEAKSKQEEDKIVAKEVQVLKAKMGERDIESKTMKELVVRLLYCEMLGHRADFGYIHCVNLIASPDILEKRTGYLATQLTIAPDNELLLLVVAAIQRDLKSDNALVVCCALTAATKLLNEELMPCIVADVQNCLQTAKLPTVRKKAIICLHAFWRRNEAAVGDVKQYQQVLCDKDPSVMACALPFLYEVCILKPDENRKLVGSFVSILKQICEGSLPQTYEYPRNGVPAPWIQIKLLKLLAVLCHGNREKSMEAAGQLLEVMRRASQVPNIGHAVVFECVKTITCLEYDKELMEAAANAVGAFLQSPNANMKYLGITSLSRIVLIDPAYAAQHKEVVMDCLEDHDETIKRKTLDLLYAMTNEDNVEVIVPRLIKFLAAAHDPYLKMDLVNNVTELAVNFLPSMEWYITTMNTVIKLGEQYVDSQTVQGMLKMIAEGSEELEEEENEAFRLKSVESYYELMETTDQLPETLIQITAWVLGEYGFMSQKYSDEVIVDKLCDLLEKNYEQVDTRGYIITALMKLTAQMTEVPSHVQELVSAFKKSQSLALQQRCYEFLELAKVPALMGEVLPQDGCCEDLAVDKELSFLNSVVELAVQHGARKYIPGKFAEPEAANTGLRMEEYVNPVANEGVNEAAAAAPKEADLDITSLVNPARAGHQWGEELLAEDAEKPAGNDEPSDAESEPAAQPQTSPGGAGAAQPDGGEAKKRKTKTKKDKEMDALFGGGKKKVKKKKKGDDGASVGSPTSAASPGAAAAPGSAAGLQLQPASVADVGSVENFGAMWSAHPFETSEAVPLPAPADSINLDQLALAIQSVSNVAKIHTLGREFIAAAKHQSGLVLCYFKVAGGPDRLEVKVRAQSDALSKAAAGLLRQALQGR